MKYFKALEEKLNFVLSRDIYMDKVEALCNRSLVGRLKYCKMEKEDWVEWTTQHWKPLINYVPTVSRLSNGWLVFLFIDGNDASKVLTTYGLFIRDILC